MWLSVQSVDYGGHKQHVPTEPGCDERAGRGNIGFERGGAVIYRMG